jgi:hypothetical protein
MAHSDAFQQQTNTLFSTPSTSKNPYESPAFNDALAALENQLSGYLSASTCTDADVQKYIEDTIADRPRKQQSNTVVDHASQSEAGQTPALDWLKTYAQPNKLLSPDPVLTCFVPKTRLVSKPDALERLAALLSSARSADDISSDLLDILGYESIELLPSVLEKRPDIKRELELRNTSVSRGSATIAREGSLTDLRTSSLASSISCS